MTSKIYFSIKELLNVHFNVNDTLQVLQHNKVIFNTWGVEYVEILVSDNQTLKCPNPPFRKIIVNEKYEYSNGLVLKVNGHHHKGYVLITLNGSDLYDVNIINNRGRVLDTFDDVYFDMLVDTIDTRIEKIENYTF